MSIADLNAELERRRAGAVELADERAELLERVAEIDETLAELGVSASTGRPRGRPRKAASSAPARTRGAGSKRGRKKTAKKAAKKTSARSAKAATRKTSRKGPSKPKGSRKRHKNDSNLVEALQGVLKGSVMGVTEVAQAVQDAGYKTTSPNFRTIVNQTLIKHPDVFSKQGRGLYTAK
ncbi:MAG: hypothetical protein ACIAQU_06490 [Phycisphaerales bacterium JB064]